MESYTVSLAYLLVTEFFLSDEERIVCSAL